MRHNGWGLGHISREVRGANGDASRAIPGGDTSCSFLVADLIGSRSSSLRFNLSGLPAGTYLWTSYHLEPITGTGLGFASGSSTTTPNTIEARIDEQLMGSATPTSLGSPGLNTTSIADSDIPTLSFVFTHDGNGPVEVVLSATEAIGSDRRLFLNGFEIRTSQSAQ